MKFMKSMMITKKHIYILLGILAILLSGVVFYQIYASGDEDSCTDSSKPFLSPEETLDFSLVTNLQDKLDGLYHGEEKVAYLTFDDGPTKVATPKILDILKEQQVQGSFFVIGYRVKEFPAIVKRAYEEGNFIANHTYSHKNSKLYQSRDYFIEEILTTDEAISEAIEVPHYHSHLFRFPNGSHSKTYAIAKKNCKQYLKEIGYCYVDWNALNSDSLKKYSAAQLLQNLKKTCENKQSLVILMHDTSDVSKSYTALNDSIVYLKEQGYTFKTFYDLFSMTSHTDKER